MKNKFVLLLLILISVVLFTACTTEPKPESINLVGTNWQVIEIDGSPVLANSFVTMGFTENLISGNGSCNNYFADYIQNGDSLSITNIVATAMACVDQAPMTQEQKFTSALEKVESVSLENGQLILNLSTGGTIVAEGQ